MSKQAEHSQHVLEVAALCIKNVVDRSMVHVDKPIYRHLGGSRTRLKVEPISHEDAWNYFEHALQEDPQFGGLKQRSWDKLYSAFSAMLKFAELERP
jgi:hypothetical protein